MKTKRIIFGLIMTAMAEVSSQADVIAQDGFAYADGTLVGQNGGTGWSGAYTDNGANFTVGSGVISASNPSGLAGQVKRGLTQTINLTNFSGGEIWLGFDGAIELTGDFGYGGISFFTGDTENGIVGATTGRDMFGIGGADNGATGAHRTIVKFDLNTNAVSLWVGTYGSAADVSGPPLQTGSLNINGADTLRFATHTGNIQLDNVVLATTLSEVTGTFSIANVGRWNGLASSILDATSLNFCTNAGSAPLTQGNLAAIGPVASFGDSYFDNSSSVAVTANNLTVAAGGVSTGTFLFDNTTALAYTLDSADPIGITGSAALLKTGNGILTLTGANTYSGTTTMTSGTLQLGNGSTTGSLSTSSIINNNGNLIINRSNAVAQGTDFSGTAISGGGSFTQAGGGTTTLTAANTYSGGTTVSQGSLVATDPDALGSGTVVLGNTAADASLLLDLPPSSNFSRAISVPASGSGMTTFGWIPAAANTGGNHPVISSAINLNGRNLILQPGAVNDHGNRLDLTGVISGTGNITIGGIAARLIFSGGAANTWVGNLAVDAGSTLQLSDGSGISNNFIPDSAAVTVDGILSNATSGNNETIGALAGSGTLSGFSHGGSNFWTLGSGDGSASFSGVIENGTGTMNITKTGTGTQTLSGPNTYSGNTVVNDGTFQVTSSGSLRFRPTSNGLTNAVSGSATATLSFTGTVSLDLTAAVATAGNIWNLFGLGSFSGPAPTLTPAAVTTTTLGSFNEITPGVWELPVIGAKWVFTESNGSLAYTTTASDYDTWKSDNGVIGGENDDDDNDGLTNREEYAFGLDPTGGTSVTPITVQLNKTAKTFSYTRRDTNKTDLTYTVWFSTNLSAWTQDTGATEVTSVLIGEVETIQVTLSNLPGNPLPAKLFIQVRAN